VLLKRGKLKLSPAVTRGAARGTQEEWETGFNSRNVLGIGIASLYFPLVAGQYP
jgi:hypothetical protein